MEICAGELMTIMKNVLSKREHDQNMKIGIAASCTDITLFLFTDSDIKSEGFSLETCRSMIALMDVSLEMLKDCPAPDTFIFNFYYAKEFVAFKSFKKVHFISKFKL